MSGVPARAAGRALLAVVLLAYPVLVYFLLDSLGAGWLGMLLIGLLALRACLAAAGAARLAAAGIAALAGLLLLAAADREAVLKLYPALVSLGLLGAFAWTLLRPPSMIERVSRRLGVVANTRRAAYMRAVTLLWCVFFAANALVSAAVTFGGSLKAWTFYNGFLSYVLIGVLFAAEYLYRQAYRARAQAGAE